MKALSIQNPWAHLIAKGIKDIENRTWSTKYRGRIYIHASAKQADFVFTFDQCDALTAANYNKPEPIMAFSAIVGEVDIVDCVLRHPSVWAEHAAVKLRKLGSEMIPVNVHVWNWVLENPLIYDHPISNVKGALSLWEYDPLKSQL
jgi:hypothetical protein